MKAVILAGGKGTRLLEETAIRPKPLVEASGHPLIWHIMQNYSRFGISDFIVLTGYKGHQIREYFADYWMHESDVTFDLSSPKREVHKMGGLPWRVTVLDTGLETMTGGRLLRAKHLLDSTFLLTYGDGVSDVNIRNLIEFHQRNGSLATLTATRPPARFGALDLVGDRVDHFTEKPSGDGSWVNGGFFVLEPDVLDGIEGDHSIFETSVLPGIAKKSQLNAYKHFGYWQPVDTLRDLERLNEHIRHEGLPWL